MDFLLQHKLSHTNSLLRQCKSRHEDYRPAAITARQCPRIISVQTWYGDNFQTCSMQETTVDCGVPALTSPCPPAREGSIITTLVTPSALATNPPVSLHGPPPTHHGLSAGVIAAIALCTILGVAFLVFMLLPLSSWRKEPRNVLVRGGPEGIRMDTRHIPKPSVSTIESGVNSDDAQDGSTRHPSPPPPEVLAPLESRPVVGLIPEGPRPPGAWPTLPQDDIVTVERQTRQQRRPSVHWKDGKARDNREGERYEGQQREHRGRERQTRLDRQMAFDLQQEEENDRQHMVVEEDPGEGVHHRRNRPMRGAVRDDIERDRHVALDIQEQEWAAHDLHFDNGLPKGVRRGGNQPVRELVDDDEEPEMMQIRHPSLPEDGNFWIHQAEAGEQRRHAQAPDEENFWLRQHYARDPVGPRPPPPVAGRRRGYRRHQPTVEDNDDLF